MIFNIISNTTIEGVRIRCLKGLHIHIYDYSIQRDKIAIIYRIYTFSILLCIHRI
jgi:hypothetical protein